MVLSYLIFIIRISDILYNKLTVRIIIIFTVFMDSLWQYKCSLSQRFGQGFKIEINLQDNQFEI